MVYKMDILYVNQIQGHHRRAMLVCRWCIYCIYYIRTYPINNLYSSFIFDFHHLVRHDLTHWPYSDSIFPFSAFFYNHKFNIIDIFLHACCTTQFYANDVSIYRLATLTPPSPNPFLFDFSFIFLQFAAMINSRITGIR